MKKINIKCQWYSIVISVFVFLFSLLSWISFVMILPISFSRNMRISVTNSIENSTLETDERYVGGQVHKENNNMLLMLINDLDQYVKNIDSMWFSSMFKKQYLSRIDSIYTYYATGEIASSQVIKGEENWLFYKSINDGDTIGDFEGTNRYTNTEMASMLATALWTQKELEARGIKFAIIVAPNKENIYWEYMPDTYTHRSISSTDILIDFLDENGVNIINPKEELSDKHLEFQLYYLYDTHWNQLGAYIGVKNVLESWNINIPALEERTISSVSLSDNYNCCGEDDLAQMIGLREKVFNDDLEYEINGLGFMNWNRYLVEQDNNEVSSYLNPKAQMQVSILLVGDSFRSAMIPALRETFSEVYVTHRSYYTAELLEEINPEYLIVEYVERYSKQINNIDSIVQ